MCLRFNSAAAVIINETLGIQILKPWPAGWRAQMLCYATTPKNLLSLKKWASPASFTFIFVFLYNNKHLVASGIWTWIFRAVGESAEHYTTTTALKVAIYIMKYLTRISNNEAVTWRKESVMDFSFNVKQESYFAWQLLTSLRLRSFNIFVKPDFNKSLELQRKKGILPRKKETKG